MRLALGADAVIELGHGTRAHQLAEALEAAALLGNGHGEHRFARLARIGTLGHEAQTIEIHVRAAGNGHQRLLTHRLARFRRAFDIGFGTGNGECAGRFEDAAGIGEHILDRRADGIGIDQDDLVDDLFCDPEGFLANLFNRGTVREQTDVGQCHAATSGQRARHRIRVGGLHTDHTDLGPHRFDVSADAGDQAATANGDEHGVDRSCMLAQDLHADRSLPGDHVRIVERMDEGELVLFLERQRVLVSVRIRVAGQHDLAAARAHRLDLEPRRRCRHHDHGAAAKCPGRQRHALRMISGRCTDDAAPELRVRKMGHLVVRAAQLEAEHALHVLALEIDAIAGALRQCLCELQRGLDRHVIHA